MPAKRWLPASLAGLLLLVQSQLWLGDSGLAQQVRLQGELEALEARNEEAREHNARLLAEVRDLREGLELLEERARVELGMVQPDEIVVQFGPRR